MTSVSRLDLNQLLAWLLNPQRETARHEYFSLWSLLETVVGGSRAAARGELFWFAYVINKVSKETKGMTGTNQTQQAEGQGLSIASLVLGILAIITSLVWYISIVLGVLAVVFGAASVKKRGRKKAIAGIVTGSIGIVLSLLIIWVVNAALPSLQKSQRDTARKNDVSVLTTDVLDYQTNNRGQLPAASDLSASNLGQITSIASEGQPTTDSAVYTVGKNCGGVSSERAYSITVELENGSPYCQGS